MSGVDAWSVLSDPTRREVFARVASGPRSVTEIADALPVSRPAVSQHLRVLADAGLVTARREGRRQVYSVQDEALARFREELDRFWTTTLTNLERATQDDEGDDAR